MTEQFDKKKHSFTLRHPVTMVMIFLTVVVFGWKSYQQLKVNLMPNISYPTLTVRTEYEGAAPEDVEKLLTRPLEETRQYCQWRGGNQQRVIGGFVGNHSGVYLGHQYERGPAGCA